jgi:hypothetical protein
MFLGFWLVASLAGQAPAKRYANVNIVMCHGKTYAQFIDRSGTDKNPYLSVNWERKFN